MNVEALDLVGSGHQAMFAKYILGLGLLSDTLEVPAMAAYLQDMRCGSCIV